ncbi:hypothetical protein [Nannocystis pusilla]|uniref:CurL C-terminal domain-containing protein n=1 Tax=Nannocystis pusilla TaxID=889268 RepID=UPI003B776DF9
MASPLAAKTEGALAGLAAAYRAHLEKTDARLSDIAYTASARRSHLDIRLAVTGRSKERSPRRSMHLSAGMGRLAS